MYEIDITVPRAAINLPREFQNPPLFLMRHETEARVMAQRLAQAEAPAQAPRRAAAPGQLTVSMSPAAAASVGPAQVPGLPGISQAVMGKPIARIQTGPRPTLPVVHTPQLQMRAPQTLRRVPRAAAGARPAVRRAGVVATVRRPAKGAM